MLSREQAAEVTATVLAKVEWLRRTPTVRSYVRDLAGEIVMAWQRKGEVRMVEFDVDVTLVPFEIEVTEAGL